jgi:hypothetical protein
MSTLESHRDHSVTRIYSLIDNLATEMRVLQKTFAVSTVFRPLEFENATLPNITEASRWFEEREKDFETIKGNMKTFISYFSDYRNLTFDRMRGQEQEILVLNRKLGKYREEIAILREEIDTMNQWVETKMDTLSSSLYITILLCLLMLIFSIAGWIYVIFGR